MLIPSRAEFAELGGEGRPILIHQDMLADLETPLSAYWKLSHDEPYSFLLESVTGGEQLARYSLLGVRPRAVLRTKGESATVETSGGTEQRVIQGQQDPLDLLEELIGPAPKRGPDFPKFADGAVGMLGYDIVRFFERLPDSAKDDLQTFDLAMLITDTLVVFDHAKNTIRVIARTYASENGYDEAAERIHAITERLKNPLPPLPGYSGSPQEVRSNMKKGAFLTGVEKAKKYIAEGDCIQTVIAQRFEAESRAHPITVYRALRSLNPSPYMFILRFGDFDLVGASPEILVSLEGRQARVRPIAGTRRRGDEPNEDARLESELLADEKERAEHIMLVDLGRNDLGRVCKFGSIKVNELMAVERYSHVMHIVSDVTGELNPSEGAYSLIRATFPAGTVSGAPKVRAMEIIDELEPTRRGLYAGSVGYIGSDGNMDLCIAIRTIFIKDGKAYVQAGGGIVFDSVPENEYEESCNKAKACLKAIEMAEAGL